VSLPAVPWQVTGNHWVALPCIHPADGALHTLGVLHRGARGTVEFAGDAGFLSGTGAPLARPTIAVDGVPRALAAEGIAWERAHHWLPTFTSPVGDLVVRGTVFAPVGRDADIAGALYALSVENRGARSVDVTVGLEGTLGHRQLRIRTARAFDDVHRITAAPHEVVRLEGSALPGLVSLAIGADGPADVHLADSAGVPHYALRRRLSVPAGGRAETAFYLAAGPERDGAEATVAVMRRRGWRDLLTGTRDALRGLEQSTGFDGVDGLVNRNLLHAYFGAVGRALDDAQYYLVRSRSPWSPHGVTIRDWEALAWTLPAVQLADPALARELLIRACELHGYAPGQGVHYLDGTLFEPGFTLEGATSYALAVERYIRETGDDQIIEDTLVADTLYLSHDDVKARRDERHPLYTTEVTPAGRPAPLPFTLHGNALVAFALQVYRTLLDEETARDVEDPAAVRAALRRHFTTGDSKDAFVAAIDLAGGKVLDDDPWASMLWLPLYEGVERTDSTYRRTAKRIAAPPRWLAVEAARLFGPDSAAVLEWLRRAPLSLGVAAEEVDAEGRAVSGGGDAALSGLVAYAAWTAVHVLGVRG
jgi:hypothetical protein